MLVIRTVCGNGIGSSLMAANNVKKICDELGIKADVASVTVMSPSFAATSIKRRSPRILPTR